MHQISDNVTQQNDNPRAVEVACMLGDSVVHVAHVEEDNSAPRRRTSIFMMLAGVLFLLVSGLAFAKGVSVAAENHVALQHHTDVLGLQVQDFRPTMLHPVFDYLAFGGLGLGIAGLALGLFRLRSAAGKSEFTLGTGANADFAAETGDDAFPLVRTSAAGTVVGVPAGMEAELLTAGGNVSLAELAADGRARPAALGSGSFEIAMPANASVRLERGAASFFVRPSAPGRARVGAFGSSFDRRAARFLLGSALVHAVLLAMLNTVAPSAKSLALDPGKMGNTTMVALQHKAPEDPNVEPDSGEADLSDDTSDSAQAGELRTAGEAGLAGNDSDREAGVTKVAGSDSVNQLSRSQAIRAAQTSGILSDMDAQTFAAFRGVADFTRGMNDLDSYGRNGTEGDSAGNFGHHSIWDNGGPGGGGDSDIIRTGRYNTIPGNDPYAENDYRPGRPGTGLCTNCRETRVPNPPAREIVKHGNLDKEIIRRHVKRVLSRVKYAYEKALLVDQELEGTVTVVFIIAADGTVMQAAADGMDDQKLQGAIAGIFKSIKFPRPQGGGIVQVTYPINLRRAG